MDNDLIVMATILTTLAEVTDGAPESTLYLAACNMNITRWQALRWVMAKSDLITVEGHWVTITPKGRELAEKIESATALRKAYDWVGEEDESADRGCAGSGPQPDISAR